MATGSLVISKRASATAILLILLAMAGIAVAGKFISGQAGGGSLPIPPTCSLNFIDPTPANNSIVTEKSINVAASSNCSITNAILYLDGTEYDMTINGNISTIKVDVSLGKHVFNVSAWTRSGEVQTETRTITVQTSEGGEGGGEVTPALEFVEPTPDNNSKINMDRLSIKVVANRCLKLESATLHWSGKEIPMKIGEDNITAYIDLSGLTSGTYVYNVSATCSQTAQPTEYQTEALSQPGISPITPGPIPEIWSETRIVTVEVGEVGGYGLEFITPPTPSDNTETSETQIEIKVEATRCFNLENATLHWNGKNISGEVSGSIANFIISNPDSGIHIYNVSAYCMDIIKSSLGIAKEEIWSPTQTVTITEEVPTPTPSIKFISPQDNYVTSNNWVFINATLENAPECSEVLKPILYWNGEQYDMKFNYDAEGNYNLYINMTNLAPDKYTYYINVTCYKSQLSPGPKPSSYQSAAELVPVWSTNSMSQTATITSAVPTPSIRFVPPTPQNNAEISENWAFINATLENAPECVGTFGAMLYWNGTPNQMNYSSDYYNLYTNMSDLTAGKHTYYIIATCTPLSPPPPDLSSYQSASASRWSVQSPTQTITIKEACNYAEPDITVYPEEEKNDAGENAYYEIKVTNKNDCESKFNISAECTSGCGSQNFTFNRSNSQISLSPEETITLLLEVSNTTKDEQSFTIRAKDIVSGKTNSTTVKFIPTACGRSSLPISVTPKEIVVTKPKSKNAILSIENPSSECVTIPNISTQCPEDWSCKFAPTPFWLWPNQTNNATLTITPDTNAEIGDYEINITAKVKNKDNVTTNQTNLTFRIINCTDADKDGFYAEGEPCGPQDCDDSDPSVNPNAMVYCLNPGDANCDGVPDNKDPKCIQRAEENIFGSTHPKYKVGDGKCDSWAGENEVNSPVDCAPQPVEVGKCGNNRKDIGEDCDGYDSSACPGLCTSTCKCPFIVGDGVCDTEAGETAAISPVDCKAKGLPILPLAIIAVLAGVGGALAFVFLKRKSALSDIMAAHGVESYSPGANPTPAMETALAQGFSPAEVASQFREAGWPEEHVKGALSDIAETQEQLAGLAEQHGVHIPAAEKKALDDYIKNCINKGFTPSQIKTALISTGWREETVKEVLTKYTSSHIKAHAKKSGVLKSTDLEKLRAYVKEELNEGHTPEQIREELLKAGWDESAIDEVLP